MIPDAIIRDMIDEEEVSKHRQRALNPEHPFVRGTAQNPDVFFQSREACNKYYHNVPAIVESTMQQFEQLTGRSYKLLATTGIRRLKTDHHYGIRLRSGS